MTCNPTLDHCCWTAGGVCEYLEENVDGRRWSCGLRRELGSWENVYADARYQAAPVAAFLALNHPGFGCGDYPQAIPVKMVSGSGLCCWGN